MKNKEAEIAWLRTQLEDAKAKDIVMIDVSHLTSITDWMVVCGGTSSRHLKSVADKVADAAKKQGQPILSIEGEANSGWVLVDLGDIIVHILLEETRDFYQLERLWSK